MGVPFRSYKSNQEKDGKRAPFRGDMTHLRRIISAFLSIRLSPLQSEKSKLPELPQRSSRPEVICEVSLSQAWTPREALRVQRKELAC